MTIADIIGDVDPIRAARGGHDLASELTMHYGLLPRANRGIFALNELPDLAGRIQVGLFNILQEGDVQIKGYPVRLPIDVAMVFTANPEDYTARGKIITPLKDRIGSEIRTHYPATVEQGVAITQQEAWTDRGRELRVPRYIREVAEGVAFAARRDKKIDKRSGVSQRLPISALENAISNAERRAVLRKESVVVPRVSDIYAALPSLTGKFELEYEGELMGADNVARELIRASVGEAFSVYLGSADLRPVVAYFEAGGNLKLREDASSDDMVGQLRKVPGLFEALSHLGIGGGRARARDGLRGGVRARGPLRPEEDRPQRRPRVHGPGAPQRRRPGPRQARAPAPHEEAGELSRGRSSAITATSVSSGTTSTWAIWSGSSPTSSSRAGSAPRKANTTRTSSRPCTTPSWRRSCAAASSPTRTCRSCSTTATRASSSWTRSWSA